jgi:hypothetical protein
MKRILIHVFGLGIIAFGGTRLGAQEASFDDGKTNYDTCMRYCMAEGRSFEDCATACKGHRNE